jgi:thiamine pyrophosphate-dependent acetolactate synthase large subunit-like protein
VTALQRAALKVLPLNQRVKFMNYLRFEILSQGDVTRKISDFDMMVAEDDQIDRAFDRATTIAATEKE